MLAREILIAGAINSIGMVAVFFVVHLLRSVLQFLTKRAIAPAICYAFLCIWRVYVKCVFVLSCARLCLVPHLSPSQVEVGVVEVG